jgi:hypothetical protein
MEVVLDHIPATQSWSTTFASNLTPAAVTVLNVSNHTWHQTANAWNEIGLQNFVRLQRRRRRDPADHDGQRGRATRRLPPRHARQRVYWNAASGTPPATGTLGPPPPARSRSAC